MFTSHEITRALVAARQETLRHEASQHRLARSIRRGRRATDVTLVRRATPADLPLPAEDSRRRAAA